MILIFDKTLKTNKLQLSSVRCEASAGLLESCCWAVNSRDLGVSSVGPFALEDYRFIKL